MILAGQGTVVSDIQEDITHLVYLGEESNLSSSPDIAQAVKLNSYRRQCNEGPINIVWPAWLDDCHASRGEARIFYLFCMHAYSNRFCHLKGVGPRHSMRSIFRRHLGQRCNR